VNVFCGSVSLKNIHFNQEGDKGEILFRAGAPIFLNLFMNIKL